MCVVAPCGRSKPKTPPPWQASRWAADRAELTQKVCHRRWGGNDLRKPATISLSWCEQNRTGLCEQNRNNAITPLSNDGFPLISPVASAEDRALRGRNPSAARSRKDGRTGGLSRMARQSCQAYRIPFLMRKIHAPASLRAMKNQINRN
jgi:hypothetical protein